MDAQKHHLYRIIIINILTIIIVAFASTPICHGQTQSGYKSYFGHESSEWHGITEDYDSPLENHVLRTAHDTIINNITYKKIEYSIAYWLDGYDEQRYTGGDFYMREDTTTGKLWCHYPNRDTDYIITDMSLSLNDTFDAPDISKYEDCSRYIVIDTFTNENRRTIVLSGGDSPRTIMFIEGVGCTNLFDYIRTSEIIGSHLVCCHQDDSIVYYSPIDGLNADDCVVHYNVGTEGHKENTRIDIWPNPCHGWFQISSSDHLKSARLYDITGHLILDNINISNRVNMRNYPRGIYILRLDANNLGLHKTIIKQ